MPHIKRLWIGSETGACTMDLKPFRRKFSASQYSILRSVMMIMRARNRWHHHRGRPVLSVNIHYSKSSAWGQVDLIMIISSSLHESAYFTTWNILGQFSWLLQCFVQRRYDETRNEWFCAVTYDSAKLAITRNYSFSLPTHGRNLFYDRVPRLTWILFSRIFWLALCLAPHPKDFVITILDERRKKTVFDSFVASSTVIFDYLLIFINLIN